MKTKVPPITLRVVSMSNFQSEILREKVPVLLCCLRQGLAYQQHLGTVEQIALRCGAALKVCLAAQEDLDAIGDAYHTTGTPAFLFFRQGREKSRLLGQSDEAGLMAFIDQAKGNLTQHSTITRRNRDAKKHKKQNPGNHQEV